MLPSGASMEQPEVTGFMDALRGALVEHREPICDRLWKNHPYAANVVYTVRGQIIRPRHLFVFAREKRSRSLELMNTEKYTAAYIVVIGIGVFST